MADRELRVQANWPLYADVYPAVSFSGIGRIPLVARVFFFFGSIVVRVSSNMDKEPFSFLVSPVPTTLILSPWLHILHRRRHLTGHSVMAAFFFFLFKLLGPWFLPTPVMRR